MAAGDACFTRRTAAEPPAFFEQPRARRPVDGPVDAAAAEQALVRGVDDRVDRLARDVAADEPKLSQSAPRATRRPSAR